MAQGLRILLIVFVVLIVPVNGTGQKDVDNCLEYIGGSLSCEERPVSRLEKLKSPTRIRHREKVQANSRDRKPIEAKIDELLLEISELQARVGRQATNRAKNAGNNAKRLDEVVKEPQSEVAGALNRTKKVDKIDGLLEQPRKWNQPRGVLQKGLQVWQEWWEKSRLKFG